MFLSQVDEMLGNTAFVVKMGLVAAAGLNAIGFHLRGGLAADDRFAPRSRPRCRWGYGSPSSSAVAGSPTNSSAAR